MQSIKIKISKHAIVNHLIFDQPIDPSTYSSSVLLNKYYRNLDVDIQREKDWRYLFIAKRTFLRHQKKDGKWICHYCKKEILFMSKRNKRAQNLKNCVTVDHKIPACKCEDKTDSKNFLVCCHKCNVDKHSMDYEIFIKRHERIK